MGRRETNARKREEFRAIMAALLERGWTAQRIAAYTARTASCVSSWKTGKSMGTNAERAELAALPSAETPAVLERLRERMAEAEAAVAERKATIAHERTEAAVAREIAAVAESYRGSYEYAVWLAEQLRSGREREDSLTTIARQEEAAAKALANSKDEATLRETALRRIAGRIAWHEKQLRGEELSLKTARAAVASYRKG